MSSETTEKPLVHPGNRPTITPERRKQLEPIINIVRMRSNELLNEGRFNQMITDAKTAGTEKANIQLLYRLIGALTDDEKIRDIIGRINQEDFDDVFIEALTSLDTALKIEPKSDTRKDESTKLEIPTRKN